MAENVFEAVKQSVSTREAAAFYGIEVKRNGMACCPFHDDKNPSMKVDQRFHCFGCGADAVSYTHLDVYKRQIYAELHYMMSSLMLGEWFE